MLSHSTVSEETRKSSAAHPEQTPEKSLHAVSQPAPAITPLQNQASPDQDTPPVLQRAVYHDMNTMWTTEFPWITFIDIKNAQVIANYNEAVDMLPYIDFIHMEGAPTEVDPNIKGKDGRIVVKYDNRNPKKLEPAIFNALLVHEMIHVANYRKYYKPDGIKVENIEYYNIHIPGPKGEKDDTGLAPNQVENMKAQAATLKANWTSLGAIALQEHKDKKIPDDVYEHVKERIRYASGKVLMETDTVLFDVTVYLEQKKLTKTGTFKYIERLLAEATDRRNNHGTFARLVDPGAYFFQFWKW